MAVTSPVRKSVGALSVSVSATLTGAGPTDQYFDSAALTADASAAELADLPIYSEFLNKEFATDADLADAIGSLGVSFSIAAVNNLAGSAVDSYSWQRDTTPATLDKPLFFVNTTDACIGVLRIALAASISS